jgi:hypothetical protein
MKKLFHLVFVFISSIIMMNAQTVPVFSYTHPSLSEIKKLAGSSDEKGHAFYIYLQETINMKLAGTDIKLRISDSQQLGLDSMFKYIAPKPEEFTLEEGAWLNSGYNVADKKMEASMGHDETEFCYLFKIGVYSFALMKADCANVIRSISFCASLYSPIDVAAFERKLKEITNNFNILSIKVNDNSSELAALKSEIAGMKENQKIKLAWMQHYIWRTDKESERRDYIQKGDINLAFAAIFGTASGLLWHGAFEKHWEEDDIIREAEADYDYYRYTLEKKDYTPPSSNSKSAKSRGQGMFTILTPYNPNQPKPELHFANSIEYCGNDHHGDNPGCNPPDKGDVYVTIDYILNMITNNSITYNFYEYVTNNIRVLQDFVNNYYTTNNYYEYVTKVEQIFNTYNTYVYNTYNNTYITNTYVVATYTLKEELKTGKIKISVLDRGMAKKENHNKGLCIASAMGCDIIAGIFIERAFHNFQEAHDIKIALKTDLKQMYNSTQTSWNSQLSIVKLF